MVGVEEIFGGALKYVEIEKDTNNRRTLLSQRWLWDTKAKGHKILVKTIQSDSSLFITIHERVKLYYDYTHFHNFKVRWFGQKRKMGPNSHSSGPTGVPVLKNILAIFFNFRKPTFPSLLLSSSPLHSQVGQTFTHRSSSQNFPSFTPPALRFTSPFSDSIFT